MTPTFIRRLRPRTPSDWIALVIASAAGGGIALTDDWLTIGVSLVFFVLGAIYRLAPDNNGNGVPDHIEAAAGRVFRIRPDVLLLFALAVGLGGCAHWSAGLTGVEVAASSTGEVVWAEGSGLSTAGDLACEAEARGEVCYRSRCVPLSVTIETREHLDGVWVCASAGPIVKCEVVP